MCHNKQNYENGRIFILFYYLFICHYKINLTNEIILTSSVKILRIWNRRIWQALEFSRIKPSPTFTYYYELQNTDELQMIMSTNRGCPFKRMRIQETLEWNDNVTIFATVQKVSENESCSNETLKRCNFSTNNSISVTGFQLKTAVAFWLNPLRIFPRASCIVLHYRPW